MPPSQATLCKLSEKALFDTESVSSWFPNVDVTYIGVTSTNWMCAWGEIETKRLYEAALKKNGRVIGRKIHFLDMVGLNHFAHWDQPHEFLQVVADGIRKNDC
ncbi:uncharacterized protein C8R40DRAFT_852635 [Lentinula edodes]|uniref:uncharacterized protein n=1 Tax=Lentinula edodes TaxID=5353 RepID=UPI001E8D8312|nr:uncharacterized protein C8R40DRAFT_852635 [Lentinula edodes]KAH7868238.1 hypothetical protein C8R40DRAFT_852635 [Lentinula edodes]